MVHLNGDAPVTSCVYARTELYGLTKMLKTSPLCCRGQSGAWKITTYMIDFGRKSIRVLLRKHLGPSSTAPNSSKIARMHWIIKFMSSLIERISIAQLTPWADKRWEQNESYGIISPHHKGVEWPSNSVFCAHCYLLPLCRVHQLKDDGTSIRAFLSRLRW
jgi:hypothetical protein